jgi:hypothetical protein
MAFSGAFTTGTGFFGPLFESGRDGDLLPVSPNSALSLAAGSGFVDGKGGGNGEVDIMDTDAEWALKARKDLNDGKDNTCCSFVS